MAKKRLTFDVEESLHSELKARAAEQGVALGTLCSSLLSSGVENDVGIEKKEPVDPSMYPNIGLEELREEALRLGKERPDGWDTLVRKINAQIVRRYKVS
jgi:hypothetical protein